MPKIRIGFATDINLVNEQVGIGTTNPTARLDVRGQIRADNSAGGGGISTISRYDGFLHSQQGLQHNVSIASTTKGNLNSLSGEIIISSEVTVTEGTSLTGGRLDSLTVTGKFDIPNGGTEEREETPEKGSTRFNEDLGQLEFYTGLEWRTTASYDGSGRGRGVFGGGRLSSTNFSTISYINIYNTGNAINFGSLTSSTFRGGGCSSSTRGLFAGGNPVTNVIEYITIASESNAIDFGDLTVARITTASCSSSTRGLWAGGYAPESNVIDYIQISTLGNALDFGDLSNRGDGRGGQRLQVSSCSSPTRGLFGGGTDESPDLIEYSTIDFVTIASTGNAVGGGDLTSKSTQGSACSNSTRGIFAEVRTSLNSVTTNLISYVTIATLGNAIKFGDLTLARFATSSTASQIRGVFAGGGSVNIIDAITIMTTGNATDFGDLTISAFGVGACSDSHGGLGGF